MSYVTYNEVNISGMLWTDSRKSRQTAQYLRTSKSNQLHRLQTDLILWMILWIDNWKCLISAACLFLSSACPPGRHGMNCDLQCQCQNSAECDSVTGACLCAPGWTGQGCSDRKDDHHLQFYIIT